ELGVVRGAVLRPVPPAPVTALGGQQRFLCLRQRGLVHTAGPALGMSIHSAGIGFASVPKKIQAVTSSWCPIHTSKLALIHEAGKIPVVVGISPAAAIVSVAVRARKSLSSLMSR